MKEGGGNCCIAGETNKKYEKNFHANNEIVEAPEQNKSFFKKKKE